MRKRKEGKWMAISRELMEHERNEKVFEQKIARLQASPEERSRLAASKPPFDYDAWVREAGPSTPSELSEMEAFLREREEERAQSLAGEEERLARLNG
jgi:hypothetical protein